MEPGKPARVESRVRTQLRNWLQYGEELGLGPYYRDRRVTAEIAGAFPSDETASTENPELNGRSASASPYASTQASTASACLRKLSPDVYSHKSFQASPRVGMKILLVKERVV